MDRASESALHLASKLIYHPAIVNTWKSALPKRRTSPGAEIARLRQRLRAVTRSLNEAQAARDAAIADSEPAPTSLHRLRVSDRIERSGQTLTSVIGLTEPDGTIIKLFGPVNSLVGEQSSFFPGRSALENIHKDDLERIHRMLDHALANPYVMYVEEFRLRHRDGSWTPVETTVVNLLDVPSISALLFSSRDITDRRQLEQERRTLEAQLNQARRLEAVGRLAGGVAHDFNNLLTAIVGNIELARGEIGLPKAVEEQLDEVAKAGRRAAELTKQLLAFSRHQFAEPNVISVHDVLTGLERLLRRVIREDIELRLDLRAHSDSVCIDPGQLEQVVVNLVVNARDAMPDGGSIVVETVVTKVDDTFHCSSLSIQPGTYFTIAVSDTGPGIPAAVRPHIFEPFFTTKSVEEGTGLGLATVHGIVKQAHGAVAVYSEEGLGTTMRVYLPISAGVTSTRACESTWPEASQETVETVLLVEDDDSVRDVAAKFLQRLGYAIHVFSSAVDALEFVRAHPSIGDVLLTDVVMPKMNGRELAEAVHAIDPRKRIVFASGYAEALFAQQASFVIPFAFLEKPYSMKSLARKLRAAIEAAV